MDRCSKLSGCVRQRPRPERTAKPMTPNIWLYQVFWQTQSSEEMTEEEQYRRNHHQTSEAAEIEQRVPKMTIISSSSPPKIIIIVSYKLKRKQLSSNTGHNPSLCCAYGITLIYEVFIHPASPSGGWPSSIRPHRDGASPLLGGGGLVCSPRWYVVDRDWA